jgi:membrane-associated phospholipid phosphatase
MHREDDLINRTSLILCATFLMAPVAGRAQARTDTTYNFGVRQFALSAAALSVFVLAVDAPVARAEHGSASAGTLNTARQFDRFGDETGILPIVGGVALAGLITGNRALPRAALHAASSVVLASIAAQAGKYVMRRERPVTDPDLDGLDFLHSPGSPAFPSGHTAAAFALATSLGDDAGKPWLRVGLYALATGTAWARVAEEEHWVSDVLAGAAIGIASAKLMSGRITIFGVRAPAVIVGPHRMGLHWTF